MTNGAIGPYIPQSLSRRLTLMCIVITLAAASLLYFEAIVIHQHGGSEQMNLLGKAFLAGHTYIAPKPDPALLALSNPYDYRKNHKLLFLDATLYDGKYYFYFGPAPTLLVWIPFYLLTGISLNDAQIGFGFSEAALLTEALLLYLVARRQKFPQRLRHVPGRRGAMLWHAGSHHLGIYTRILEISVVAGWFFTNLGLLCAWQALNKRSNGWLCFASLAFGLALASRLSLGLDIIIMAAAALYFRALTPHSRKSMVHKPRLAISSLGIMPFGAGGL